MNCYTHVSSGLEPTELLTHLPLDTGMGFVIVHHLAPERVSSLAEILSRATKMPVCEVRDEPEVEPDHIRKLFLAIALKQLAPRRAIHTGGMRSPDF